MAVKAVPDGYTTVTPYLIVRGGARALELYQKAFNAEEVYRLAGPDGKIGHAEFNIGNARMMLADEHPERGARSPESMGGTPVSMCLYVDDVDAWVARALAAGCTVERPVKDQFYGDRSGMVRDPFGHQWTIATHKEDVTPEEMRRRMEEFAKKAK